MFTNRLFNTLTTIVLSVMIALTACARATPTSPPLPPATATAALGIGSTMVSDLDVMILVFVPEGEFTMGSDSDEGLGYTVYPDEKPAHTVYLDAFWIDQTEMTNKKYQMCVDAGACGPPSALESLTHPKYYGNPEFDNYPVVYVSWEQASAYCAWAKRRLPTEAEWEKAARGTDARIYPWGNEEPHKDLLNYNLNLPDVVEVGSYPNGASPYGAYDMSGNVREWVNDWYSANYYESSPASNPLGPESGDRRVTRSGSPGPNDPRSAKREQYYPLGSAFVIGFRCASDTSP